MSGTCSNRERGGERRPLKVEAHLRRGRRASRQGLKDEAQRAEKRDPALSRDLAFHHSQFVEMMERLHRLQVMDFGPLVRRKCSFYALHLAHAVIDRLVADPAELVSDLGMRVIPHSYDDSRQFRGPAVFFRLKSRAGNILSSPIC